MGHFAFQERDETTRLTPGVIDAIQKASPGSLKALDLVWCKDRVLRWCEEIYCDLFALWLIGPSFSFSFIELFGLSRLGPAYPAGGKPRSSIASLNNFSDSHPAQAFRLGEHVRFLNNPALGWWDKIKDGNSHYVRLLKDAEVLDQGDFRFSSQSHPTLDSIALKAFLQVVPQITTAEIAAFAGVDVGSKSFEALRPKISEYLSYGVVPSMLSVGDQFVIPTIVATANAAHLFYLEELDTLIRRIGGARADCLECRALWSERLEMWTSKALEDVNSQCP
jgi:hypothetical protein